jgi:hypothetical protein
MIEIRDSRCHPLAQKRFGRHVFGGRAFHRGSIPQGSTVPLHLLLTLDLSDPKCPFGGSGRLTKLPFYYPLKYGTGGSSVQYEVLSDEEIRIVYIDPPEADSDDVAYVKVPEFPELEYGILPPIGKDDPVDWFTITLRGTFTLDHSSNNCQNPGCRYFRREAEVHILAAIPPVKIDEMEELWWEFQGAYVLFYFCLCRGCNTIIAFNRCT